MYGSDIVCNRLILFVLNNNQNNNKQNNDKNININKTSQITLSQSPSQISTQPQSSQISTQTPQTPSQITQTQLNQDNNINNINNIDIIDSNYVSPYSVSYSAFYYDHNTDPYISVYTNKNWLYDPWNTNLKYI